MLSRLKMSEIETQVFGIRKEHSLNRLRQCAREKDVELPEVIFEGIVTTIFYKKEIVEDGIIMRLRTEDNGKGTRNILTIIKLMESSHVNILECQEENLVIMNLAQASRFIKLMGYVEWGSSVKNRKCWLYNGARLNFDRIGDGDEWLRIETADRRRLDGVLEDLGYTLEQCSINAKE